MANLLSDEKKHLKPGLYIVATPIGNLSDITERAKQVIAECDYLLCEDTRVTGKLLSSFGLKAKMEAYHDHNGDRMRPRVEAWLNDGARVALVSDAGTPLISDPGYKLVHDMAELGHKVIPVPGASALTAALSVAGLPTDKFLFAGFPPQKSGARQSWFKELGQTPASLVFYESTRRLTDSLKDAQAALGDREAAVGRELTKTFEEVIRGNFSDIIKHYETSGTAKGEAVVVVGPPKKEATETPANLDIDTLLKALIESHGVKGASNLVAQVTGLNKRNLYTRAQELKDSE